jgi:hypothetical protein
VRKRFVIVLCAAAMGVHSWGADRLAETPLFQLGGSAPPRPEMKLEGVAEWIATPGFGSALEVLGNGAKGSLPLDLRLPAEVTVSLFVKVGQLPLLGTTGKDWPACILSYGDRKLLIRVYATGTLYAGLQNAQGALLGVFGDTRVQVQKWQHLALTWSSRDSVGKLYLDGEAIGTITGPVQGVAEWKDSALVIGQDPDNCPFTGAVADVRIYPFAMTAGEVQSVARKNEVPFSAPPNFPGLYSFVVAPFSPRPILPTTTLPADRISAALSFTATPGEDEAASFVLRPVQDMDNVTFRASELKAADGSTLPAEALDLKLVKCWYQGPAAWRNEAPGKAPVVLVPELLLHDDALVKVDETAQKNYVRYGTGAAATYVDKSDPTTQNVNAMPPPLTRDHPIYDAQTLQPLPLKAGRNQQFFVTLQVPETAGAGVYTGTLRILAGGKSTAELAVKATILPFRLAEPRTYYDLDKRFVSSIYHSSGLSTEEEGSLCYNYRSPTQFLAELRDLRKHGVTAPTTQIDWRPEMFAKMAELRKQAGMDNSALYFITNGYINFPWPQFPPTQETFDKITARAIMVLDMVEKNYGHRNAYFYGVDEVAGDNLKLQPPYIQAVHKGGGRFFNSGYKAGTVPPGTFAVLGDLQDLFICAAASDAAESAQWHAKGKDIWCYAYPQAGVENPEPYRRNFGLVNYKNNYDGNCDFPYSVGFGPPWNDVASTIQRDMCFAYMTADGVVDTVAWESYREALDDIRYATSLRLAARAARGGTDAATQRLATEADEALAQRNVYASDMDETRSLLIAYILKLKGLQLPQ